MADLGVGFIDILPRSDKFTASLVGQMKGALSKLTGEVNTGLGKAINVAQVGMVALGAAAVVGIAKGIQATTEWAGEVRSLQRVTGLAAEDASRLAGAGDLLGISVTKLNTGFGLLAKNVVNGSANFDKYNIATKDAQGNTLPFLDILGNVSDKFATLAPGADQAAFAMNIFGRSGKDLIPVLARGSAGLQDLYDKAAAAGLVMSQDTLDASKNLSIAQRDLGDAVKGASIAIGTAFIPIVTDAVNLLTGFVELVQAIPRPLLNFATAASVAGAAMILFNKAFVGLLLGKAIPALLFQVALGLEAVGATSVASGLANTAGSLQAFVAAGAGLGPLVIAFALVAAAIKVHADSIKRNLAASAEGIDSAVNALRTDMGSLSPTFDAVDLSLLGLNRGVTEFTVAFGLAITAGEAAGQTFEDVAKTTQDKLTAAFSEGKISADDYRQALEITGLTARQSSHLLQQTANASDKLTVHFNAAGDAIQNWAGLTGQAVRDFRDNFTSTMRQTFGTLGVTVKDTFNVTQKKLDQAFHQMLLSAIRFKADVAAVLALKPGTLGLNATDTQKFEQFLLQQAPGYIDAFVRASTSKQREWVAEWRRNVSAINSTTSNIHDATITVKADTSQANSALDALLAKLRTNGITSREQGIIKGQVNIQQGGATGGWVTTRGIRRFAMGGSTTDTVPAMLTPGEFVMRREAVERIGIHAMRAMNEGGPVSGVGGMSGALRIYDWRNGLATLDAEIGWEDAVRTR